MPDHRSPQPLSAARSWVYALGNAGFQMGERLVISVAIYFYLPPAGRGLDAQVSQEVLLGGLTAFGLAMLIGRVFDAIADPLVAQASDRSASRFGRRRLFLLLGAPPMVLSAVLLFWPPGAPGSHANFLWLAAVLSAYFIFFTIYVAPYLALVPEIAWGPGQRVRLATVMAIVALPIVGLYSVLWPVVYDALRNSGFDATTAMRIVVVATAVVSLVLCVAPLFAVNEKRHTHTVRSELALWPALRATLVNYPFLLYLGAQALFIIGINLIHPTIIYYVTVVLGRSEGFTGILGAVLFASTALSFALVNRAARRIGAKHAIIACVVVFAAGLWSLALLVPGGPGTPQDGRNLVILFTVMAVTGLPLAGFLVLPYVLISQVIDREARLSGHYRAAMYFGVQGLLTKLMYGISAAILAYLFARFGNSAEQPFGVLLVGPIAGLFCLASAALFTLYPEREVLGTDAAE